MTQETFYRDQASVARRDADATALPNVRDRCLRSAATWDAMADREGKMSASRAIREAAKALAANPAIPNPATENSDGAIPAAVSPAAVSPGIANPDAAAPA